jgi:trehalose 6-phosphate phosphatase
LPFEAWLCRAVGKPKNVGVFVDFDGTLARIVDDPSDATPVAGAVEALAALAQHVGRVAVISGRPASYLASRLGDSGATVLIGLYGLERWDRATNRVVTQLPLRASEAAGPDRQEGRDWGAAVEEAALRAQKAGIPGVVVERKGLTVTLHYRARPSEEAKVRSMALALAEQEGLAVHAGKMSVELTPPVGVDKGTAVAELCEGLSAVLFAGDDTGDLPAFAELERRRSLGVATLSVAVSSEEAPADLLRAADVVLDDPAEVVEMLRMIARTFS